MVVTTREIHFVICIARIVRQGIKNMKKKAPHWMNCECKCHGDWGEGYEDSANSCPHCQPEKYPDYEVENI